MPEEEDDGETAGEVEDATADDSPQGDRLLDKFKETASISDDDPEECCSPGKYQPWLI